MKNLTKKGASMNYYEKIAFLYSKMQELQDKEKDILLKKYFSTNGINNHMNEVILKINDRDGEEKIYIIEKELKKYICLALKVVDGISEEDIIREMGISWYVKRLYDNLGKNSSISKQERKNAIDNLTLYLIKIISKLQNYELQWYILEDETLIEAPHIDNSDGIIKAFITNEKTNELKSFNELWKICKNLSLEEKRKK